MTHKTAIVCSIIIGFLGVQSLFGQGCGVLMTKNYSVYATASADTSHIYTAVVTDGSASCTPSISCPCNTATHTPKSYNKIGTVGGWGTGTPQCVNCYLSYTNNQSIVATAGVVYPFQANGEVDCSLAGAFFAASLGGLNEVQAPACGSAGGQILTIFAIPQRQTCNAGKITYTTNMSVSGSGINHVSNVIPSVGTDNEIVLQLVGGPYNDSCTNTAGASQWCFKQDYKTHSYPTKPNGNILWNLKIYCGGPSPDINTQVKQAFQCL